jgi:hypothetical protein
MQRTYWSGSSLDQADESQWMNVSHWLGLGLLLGLIE